MHSTGLLTRSASATAQQAGSLSRRVAAGMEGPTLPQTPDMHCLVCKWYLIVNYLSMLLDD